MVKVQSNSKKPPVRDKGMVKISISLTNKETMAFTKFLKKVSFADYRNNAKDDDEAYLMQSV